MKTIVNEYKDIIAGVSGKSIIRGLLFACLGLLISCAGAEPMTSYDRFTFAAGCIWGWIWRSA